MPNGLKRKLVLITVFLNVITSINSQMAMPMYIPQPVYAFPPPIAVAIQLPEPVTTTTTTTTTTPATVALAIPIPVPMPVQFAVPAPPPPVFCQGKSRPKGCPPCPPCVCMPSCTPAFFSYCSPCHLKCRCHNLVDAPIPMPPNPPLPVPGPAYPLPIPIAPAPPIASQPVVVIPFPQPLFSARRRQRRYPSVRISSSNSDDTSDYHDTSSDSKYLRNAKKFKRNRMRLYRRNAEALSGSSDADLVKPVVSYISKNGDVKFETEISRNEAMAILHDGGTKDNSVIVSLNKEGRTSGRKYNKGFSREMKESSNKPRQIDMSLENLAKSFKIT